MTVKVKNANPLRERKCLCCRGAFLSEGFHNRMCDKCKDSDNFGNDFAFGGDVGVIRMAERA